LRLKAPNTRRCCYAIMTSCVIGGLLHAMPPSAIQCTAGRHFLLVGVRAGQIYMFGVRHPESFDKMSVHCSKFNTDSNLYILMMHCPTRGFAFGTFDFPASQTYAASLTRAPPRVIRMIFLGIPPLPVVLIAGLATCLPLRRTRQPRRGFSPLEARAAPAHGSVRRFVFSSDDRAAPSEDELPR
jgi:hypothetical protein